MANRASRLSAGARVTRRSILAGIAEGGAAAAAAVLVGCGDDSSGSSKPSNTTTASNGSPAALPNGGTVHYAGTVAIPTLDPYANISQTAQVPASLWYNRLYRFKSGPEIKQRQYIVEAEVAANLPEFADGGATVVIKMRPDVKFHQKAPVNGRGVTSDDIVQSFDRFRALSGRASVFDVVDKIETPDPLTVTFMLKTPSASFLPTLADGSFLHIIPKETVDPSNKQTKGDPIGSGPWVFDSHQPGVLAKGVANEAYFRGRPKADSLEFIIIPEAASRAAAFRTGKLDYYQPVADDLDQLKSVQGSQVQSFSGGAYQFVSFDLTGPFKDIRLRRAVSMAIDRDKYNATFFNGAGDWCSVMPAGFTPWYLDPKGNGYGETGKYLKFDKNAAKVLVKEAGYNGDPIKLSSSTLFDKSQIELTGAMLQDIGLNIQLVIGEHAAFIQTINAGKGMGGGLGWVVKPAYPDPTSYLSIYWLPGSTNQNTRFDDTDIQAMIVKQDTQIDTNQRAKTIQEIQVAIASRAYGAFLVTQPAFTAVSGRIKNYSYIDNVSGIEGFTTAAVQG